MFIEMKAGWLPEMSHTMKNGASFVGVEDLN